MTTMVDPISARKAFDAGMLSMGFNVNGQEVAPDKSFALKAFTQASQLDPTMCDAWVGRLACGDNNFDTIQNAFSNRNNTWGREQRRLGIPPRNLEFRFYTGLYIEYPASSPDEIAIAFAASLLESDEYQQANDILEEVSKTQKANGITENNVIISYMKALLNYRTKRWPDVIAAVSGIENWNDPFAASGAYLMSGTACAQLGMFGEAIRRLEAVESGPLPNSKISAMLCHGLCLRELGKEAEAKQLFENIYTQDPSNETNNRALKDPSQKLVITTKEIIDSRTNLWDPASVPTTPPPQTPSSVPSNTNTSPNNNSSLINPTQPTPGQTTQSPADNPALLKAQQLLDKQIGLADVKMQVDKLKSSALLAKIRAEKGMSTSSRSQHLAFTGPPGTGKTTIARIIAQIYCALGLLATDKVLETKRADFVGQHLGSTAIKSNALIDSAMDGVLFIDEAYTLIQTGLSGGDAFGQEAIDTLLARMENDRGRLVVIIAGYDGEIDRFLEANEGLASRFARRIRFNTYTPEELTEIAETIARNRDSDLGYDAIKVLEERCEELSQISKPDSTGKPRNALDLVGNGRFIRNIIESAEEEREYRLTSDPEIDIANLTESDLRKITAADVNKALNTVLGISGLG